MAAAAADGGPAGRRSTSLEGDVDEGGGDDVMISASGMSDVLLLRQEKNLKNLLPLCLCVLPIMSGGSPWRDS